MNTCKSISLVFAIALIFSGCATNGQIDKQARGSGLGALTGAVLAYGLSRGHSDKEIAIVVGTLLGAAAGDAIGRKLTEADKVIAGRSLNDSLEYGKTGESTSWSNPDTGHSGTSTTTRTVMSSNNQPCREFTTTVSIGGNPEEAYGYACRQADGSWEIQP